MSDRYTVSVAPPARRALAERLPEAAAIAAWEFITGVLADNPTRIGKPLREPFTGQYVARRGSYRVFYRINEKDHSIVVLDVKHRAAAYRVAD